MPVDHLNSTALEQLGQLAELLRTDPESGMDSVRRWFPMVEDDRNPEFPDPIPHESEILARAIGSTPLAKLGAMGHEGSDDYATCLDARHWQKLPEGMRRLSDEERQRIADEIEMDML